MSQRNLDEFSGAPLTEDERREYRRLLEDHRRARWLWGSLYRLVIAGGAIAAAIGAARVVLGNYWK